jgi:hypothetical protein
MCWATCIIAYSMIHAVPASLMSEETCTRLRLGEFSSAFTAWVCQATNTPFCPPVCRFPTTSWLGNWRVGVKSSLWDVFRCSRNLPAATAMQKKFERLSNSGATISRLWQRTRPLRPKRRQVVQHGPRLTDMVGKWKATMFKANDLSCLQGERASIAVRMEARYYRSCG